MISAAISPTSSEFRLRSLMSITPVFWSIAILFPDVKGTFSNYCAIGCMELPDVLAFCMEYRV